MADNYNMFGIRYDDREFKIGDELPKSNRWEDGTDTEEQLDGTCAIMVSDESNFLEYLDGMEEADCGELDRYNWALEQNYNGKHIYLVAINTGWGWEYGEDEGEVVMNGAEVVRIIK